MALGTRMAGTPATQAIQQYPNGFEPAISCVKVSENELQPVALNCVWQSTQLVTPNEPI